MATTTFLSTLGSKARLACIRGWGDTLQPDFIDLVPRTIIFDNYIIYYLF